MAEIYLKFTPLSLEYEHKQWARLVEGLNHKNPTTYGILGELWVPITQGEFKEGDLIFAGASAREDLTQSPEKIYLLARVNSRAKILRARHRNFEVYGEGVEILASESSQVKVYPQELPPELRPWAEGKWLAIAYRIYEEREKT